MVITNNAWTHPALPFFNGHEKKRGHIDGFNKEIDIITRTYNELVFSRGSDS